MKDRMIFTLIQRPCHVSHLSTCTPGNLLPFSSKAHNERFSIQGLLIRTRRCSRLFVLRGFTQQFSGIRALLWETLFRRAIPNSLTILHLFFPRVHPRPFEQNPLQLTSFSSAPLIYHSLVREIPAEHRDHCTSCHRAGNFPKQTGVGRGGTGVAEQTCPSRQGRAQSSAPAVLGSPGARRCSPVHPHHPVPASRGRLSGPGTKHLAWLEREKAGEWRRKSQAVSLASKPGSVFSFRRSFLLRDSEASAGCAGRAQPSDNARTAWAGGAEPPQRRAADQSPAADTSLHAHPSPRPHNETQARSG